MKTRPDGGTGLRRSLKSFRSKDHEGSNPSRAILRNIKFNPFKKHIRQIYGPYIHESVKGPPRRRIIIVFEDGSKTTMAYARWKMIQHLERKLLSDEHVDHINENQLDDRISNLQLLSLVKNNQKSSIGRPSPLKGIEKGWRHGTVYGFMKKGCKCKECQKKKKEFNDARNERRRKGEGYGPRKK